MPTDDTMQQIIRMVQAGWEVTLYPVRYGDPGGITAQKPGQPTIWVDDANWQDDIPAAWARLVEKWERQVQE